MSSSYSHETFQLNNIHFTFEDVVNGKQNGFSTFEKEFIQFIRKWWTGESSYFFHTSGSTGKPKLIKATRHQLLQSAALTQQFFNYQPTGTSLIVLPIQYIAAKMQVVRAWRSGMKIMAFEPSANPFLPLDPMSPFETTSLVPYQLETILSSPVAGILNNFKNILVGGAPIHPTLSLKLKDIKAHVYGTFGMTETFSQIALRKLNGDNADEIFTTLPGIVIEEDKRGCLSIHAPFLKNPLHTHDLIEKVSDQRFIWKGRIDHVINSGGIKISPEKIERDLRKQQLDSIKERNFLIGPMPDKKLGQKVVMIIEGIPIENIEEISQKLGEILSPHERPREILFLENFFYTPSGKVNRKKTFKKIFPANLNL